MKANRRLRDVLAAGHTYSGDPTTEAYVERSKARIWDEDLPYAVCDQLRGSDDGRSRLDDRSTQTLIDEWQRWLSAGVPSEAQVKDLVIRVAGDMDLAQLYDLAQTLGLGATKIPTTTIDDLDMAIYRALSSQLANRMTRMCERWDRLRYFDRPIPPARAKTERRDRAREPAVPAFVPNRDRFLGR